MTIVEGEISALIVDIWYEGKLYSGYIADRVKTEFNDRLIFVESGVKPNVI